MAGLLSGFVLVFLWGPPNEQINRMQSTLIDQGRYWAPIDIIEPSRRRESFWRKIVDERSKAQLCR